MSYANMDAVPTQTAGVSELLASDWNTYVRDNFDSIKFGHVVCTSGTRPTGIAEGTMIYETDTQKVLVYNGSSWVEVNDLDNLGGVSNNALLKTVAKNRVAVNSSGSSWSNPTSFTEIPQSDDRSALNISFVKLGGADTNLVINVSGSAILTSGISQTLTWGVRVASTSYTVAAIIFPGAVARVFWGGTTMITGLAAGTYSIDPMLKSQTAAAITLAAGDDTVSICVTETFG
jgi:hypothetical protein